ncbi:MAG: DUF4942 domain-containing protein [Bacteroidales bacterium]|nr:DUF4942 domain-containing protein [Bacteroidales bacterium]
MRDYQNIFNKDFYPTPADVIEQMIGTDDICGKVILEPSFGSGNIVKYLNEHGAKEVLGCEINDKLRHSVSGVRVIENDFLQVTPEEVSHIDMIVMNPPFSQQEKHILHAWEVAPGGCEIITLCNASLLERHYSLERQVSDLINLYGYSDDLGDVFSHSDERRTDCGIALIKLYKPGTGANEFDGYFTDEADDPEAQGNGLISYSFVREAVQRYTAAVSRVDAVLAASNEINDLTKAFDFTAIKFGAYRTNRDNYSHMITKDEFRKELQKNAWKWLFDKFKMRKYVTSSVMETINRFVEKQSSVPFTMRNIYKMVEMIVGTHGQRMQQVILDAFDIICKFSDDNVTYSGEKWKTNSAHMVNRKFIVPYMCKYETYCSSYYDHVNLHYSGNSGKMDDVVKALCNLTGTTYDNIPSLYEFVGNKRLEWGQWYEWAFFRIKGYKKGTMHFEFLDEDVWVKFNQSVASVRGWELPTNVKVKKSKKN